MKSFNYKTMQEHPT